MKSDIIGSMFFGVMIFIIAVTIASMKLDQPTQKQIEPDIRPWIEDLCETVALRNPGGLDFEIGEVCYHPDLGFIESRNLERLLPEDYERMVIPVKAHLKRKSEAMGL